MPLAINDVETLQRYIKGVMSRANHHAGNVDGAVLALAGAIIWRKDEADEIEVMTQDGDLKNVLWVKVKGQRYAFSYNHEQERIEMRQGSTQGEVMHAFDDNTPTGEIKNIFLNL